MVKKTTVMVKFSNDEVLDVLSDDLKADNRLTKKQKILLGQLIIYSGLNKYKEDGYFFRSNADLCNDCGITEKTLISGIVKLESLGYISRKAGLRGKASEYRINDTVNCTVKYTVNYSETNTLKDSNLQQNYSNNYSATPQNYSTNYSTDTDPEADTDIEGDYTVYLEKNLRRIIREEITCMKHEIIRELKNEIMDMIEEKAKDMRTEKRDNDNDFKIEENDNAACMEDTRDTDTVEIDNGFCDFDFNPDEYRGIIYGGKGKKDYKALNDEYSKAYKALTDYNTSTDEKIMAADRITSMLDNDELTQRQATAAKKAIDNFNRNKSITYRGWTEESNALREIMMPVLNEWMTTHTHESAKRLLPMIEPMLEFVSKGECPEEFGTIFNEDFRGAAGLPTMLMQRLISEAA